MAGPLLESFSDHLGAPLEVHESGVRSREPQPLPIPAGQGGAAHDDASTVADGGVDEAGERVEPGAAVGVGERHAAPHLVHVRLRMEVVSVVERPPERGGQAAADLALAARAHPHQHDRPNRLGGDSGLVVGRHACMITGEAGIFPNRDHGGRPGQRVRLDAP